MKNIRRKLSQWLICFAVLLLTVSAMTVSAHAADPNGAKQALANAAKQNMGSINIQQYAIPHTQFNDYYQQWRASGAFPWYLDGYTYYYNNRTGYVTNVEPKYWDANTYSRTKFEQRTQEILNEAIKEGMSDWQKALSLYNYLAAQTAYSEDYPQAGGIQRNAYGAIVNRDAVCVGYAYAYMELLSRCGIRSVVVGSKAMNHQWNLVLIRGNWYHVDVTWGDPLRYGKDANGVISHDYFLLSDAAISDSDHEHHGWTKTYECPDTFFDTNTFWNDMNNHIWYMDDSVSFLRKGDNKTIKIYRRDEFSGEQTLLCEQPTTVVNITGTSYYYANYGFSLWEDTLYFSDAANVYALSPAGGDAKVIYRYNTDSNKKTIYGTYVYDDTIYLTVKDSYNQTSKITVPLPASGHTHDFVMTDTEPTCQRTGYTTFRCSCGQNFTSGKLKTVDHKSDSYTVVKEPTWDSAGTKNKVCIWCKKTVSETLPALSTVSASFRDVSSSDYFHLPVLWAYVRGVTSGTSAGMFSPTATAPAVRWSPSCGVLQASPPPPRTATPSRTFPPRTTSTRQCCGPLAKASPPAPPPAPSPPMRPVPAHRSAPSCGALWVSPMHPPASTASRI